MRKISDRRKRQELRSIRYIVLMVIVTMGIMIFSASLIYDFNPNAEAHGIKVVRNLVPEPTPPPTPETVPEQVPEVIYEPELTAEERRLIQLDPNLPMIALTFDDGPFARTNEILDILEEHNVVATFYVIGNQVERHSDIILRAHNMGSEIANHSWSHASFDRISDEYIHTQIYLTNAIVESITGVSPTSIRPPYGRVNDNARNITRDLGMSIMLWSVDPSDYLNRSPERIYNDVMNVLQDRDVILLHDLHARTVDATRLLVPSLIERGFQLVTVSELMYFSDITQEPGEVYRHARGDGRGW